MKKIAVLSLITLGTIGCSTSAPVSVANQPANVNTSANKGEMTVMSHSAESVKPTANQKSSSTESPMAKPVDVSKLTANVEKAVKVYEAKPNDANAKENLAMAYFERASVLTKAAQYRAALGDFRKGLKLDPDDKPAKDMHDQIIAIFKSKSINREPPKEGEEPAPLPFGS